MSRGNLFEGFPRRSDTNGAVSLQKMARENIGSDLMRGHCAADLRPYLTTAVLL